jgi:hypothetical protein
MIRKNILLSITALAFSFNAIPSPIVAQAKPAPLSGGPKTIASRERVSVLIDREINGSKSYIVIKIAVPTDSEIKGFLLASPPRVVVDFDGPSIKKSEIFPAPDNSVIKQVRLGAHPSKIRFVLDMVQDKAPQYELKTAKRQAIIKFLEGDVAADEKSVEKVASAAKVAAAEPSIEAPAPQIAAQSAPTVAVPQTPTPLPTVTPSPSPAVPSPAATAQKTLSDIEPKLPVEDTSAKVATVNPALPTPQAQKSLGTLASETAQAPQKTSYLIKGYKFEYMPDKTPVLKIVLNKPKVQMQVSKDDESYEIRIADCGLEKEDLELPQFPPHDFAGFVMVVAEQDGNNVALNVMIDEGVVLTTSVNGNEIWVKKP